MRWNWLMVIVTVGVLLGIVSCGGGDDSSSDDPASATAKQIFERFLNRDYEEVWKSLHPSHQVIATESAYIACQQGKSVPWNKVAVLEEHTEYWEAPELGQVQAQAVQVQLTGDSDAQTGTLHLLKVDGNWRWLLDEDTAKAYKENRCP